MVSALWKACSEGDYDAVRSLLDEQPDVEIKDHTGASPLIQAVRGGHLAVVQLLLTAGANPFSASSQGRPETYTTDDAILAVLADARDAFANAHPDQVTPPASSHIQDGPPQEHQVYDQPPQNYYQPIPPPGADPSAVPYPYYFPEGAAYYVPPPPPPLPAGEFAIYPGQLPPPEIAKTIPCRFYPACRYGASCMFAHPQPAYYPVPPPHYPPFDPNSGAPYPAQFYPPPPPPFSPAGPPPPQQMISPAPSPSHIEHHHHRVPSTADLNGVYPPPPSGFVMSPMAPPFGPSSGPQNGPPPPPAAYGPFPGAPAYPHLVPYPPPPPPLSPTHHRKSSEAVPTYPYPPYPPVQSPPAPADGPDARVPPREPRADREAAIAGRKRFPHASWTFAPNGKKIPGPCMFFPSGKCRNGNECRFQHIVEEVRPLFTQPHARAPFRRNTNPAPADSGPDPSPADESSSPDAASAQEDKNEFEVKYPHTDGIQAKAAIASQISNTPKFMNGNGHHFAGPRHPHPFAHKNHLPYAPRPRPVSAPVPPKVVKQRVPTVDDFPSLNGTSAPRTSLNGHTNGSAAPTLTAAQILKAAAPAKAKPVSTGSSVSGDNDKATPSTTDWEGAGSNGSTVVSATDAAPLSPSLVAERLATVAIEVPPQVA